ncbi:hypothetical protein [Leptolyngbya phage Lbo-JY16]
MKKIFWIVTLPGYRFSMGCTEPLTHDEALECVRSICPSAIGVE